MNPVGSSHQYLRNCARQARAYQNAVQQQHNAARAAASQRRKTKALKGIGALATLGALGVGGHYVYQQCKNTKARANNASKFGGRSTRTASANPNFMTGANGSTNCPAGHVNNINRHQQEILRNKNLAQLNKNLQNELAKLNTELALNKRNVQSLAKYKRKRNLLINQHTDARLQRIRNHKIFLGKQKIEEQRNKKEKEKNKSARDSLLSAATAEGCNSRTRTGCRRLNYWKGYNNIVKNMIKEGMTPNNIQNFLNGPILSRNKSQRNHNRAQNIKNRLRQEQNKARRAQRSQTRAKPKPRARRKN